MEITYTMQAEWLRREALGASLWAELAGDEKGVRDAQAVVEAIDAMPSPESIQDLRIDVSRSMQGVRIALSSP